MQLYMRVRLTRPNLAAYHRYPIKDNLKEDKPDGTQQERHTNSRR